MAEIENKTNESESANALMLSYGQWLERFLNATPRYSDLFELAQSALKLLKIEYEITESDPVFYQIREIAENTPEGESIFMKWNEFIYATPIHESSEALMGVFLPGPVEETYTFLTPAVSGELLGLGHSAEAIREILRGLQANGKPWRIAIPEMIESAKEITEKWGLENRLKDYEGLTAALKIEKGAVREITKFAQVEEDPRPMFRWSTVTARILFGFLNNGGQEHFSFCARCGKFMLVQRKGRKRFCSDICRVYEHQEKTGTGAKILHPVVPGGRRQKTRV